MRKTSRHHTHIFPAEKKHVFMIIDVGVSKNRCTRKWMLQIMADDLGGNSTPIFGNTHVDISIMAFKKYHLHPKLSRFLASNSATLTNFD